MQGFWKTLRRPFFVLAPMADVTDPAYRRLIARIHPPDAAWTEFVSADGLYHTREARKDGTTIYDGDAENPLMRDLQYSEAERPVVAQIFGSNPDTIAYAAQLAEKLGFDGVDLNFGCPDRSIEKQGAGAAMIKTPDVARAVIRAAKGATKLPVSVKTRIGYNTEIMEEWLPVLLQEDIAALTVHLRTRKEMSLVPAHWELMPKAVEIRNRVAPHIPILGNGDITDLDDAREKVAESGADGAMLGRAIFGNPWLFAGRKPEDTPPAERVAALIALAREFEDLRPTKSFHLLKKHIKAFVTGFDGAAELRARMMETESAEGLAKVAVDNPVPQS